MNWSKYDKLEALTQAVEKLTGFSIEQIRSASREQTLVDVRRITIVMATTLYPNISLVAWGEYFHRKHCTLVYYRGTHEQLYATDMRYKKLSEQIAEAYRRQLEQRDTQEFDMFAVYGPDGNVIPITITPYESVSRFAAPNDYALSSGYKTRPVKVTVTSLKT